ncbi:MAG: flippase [Patescibacteria group bacterium]|nr:flippase [Patescibacteria group bacterium]
MSLGSSVAKNTVWLMAATAGQKVVAFLAFYVIARLTGPHITGVYFYGVSVTSVFVIISDLGMTPVVIRSIAGGKEDGERLFSTVIRAKMFLVPIAVLASIGYGTLMHQTPEIMGTIALACIAMSADAFHLVLYGTLRGKQNLKPEALGMLIGQILSGIGGVTAALLHLGPMGLAGALGLGSIWNVIWASRSAVKHGMRWVSVSLSDLRNLALEAWPFAVAGMAVKVYSYIDSLMIQAYNGTVAVGYYAVAYKMTYAMQFLPLTFTAALYPALSHAYANKEHDEVRKTFLGSLRFMAAISFPISAGLSALAPRLMLALYGQAFSGAIPAMAVLPWVLIPIFLDFPVGALLNGSHRAHLKTIAMLGTMVANAILNLILVPLYGPLGAAWAGVFSFSFLYAIGIGFTYRDAGGLWNILLPLLKSLPVAALSWFIWRYVGGYMPLPMAFLFGAAISIILMFAVRLMNLQEVMFFWKQLSNRFFKQENIHADE